MSFRRLLPARSAHHAVRAVVAGAWMELFLAACQGPDEYHRGADSGAGQAGSAPTGAAGSSVSGAAGSIVTGTAGTLRRLGW